MKQKIGIIFAQPDHVDLLTELKSKKVLKLENIKINKAKLGYSSTNLNEIRENINLKGFTLLQ